jgi:anti-anti-sigma factor
MSTDDPVDRFDVTLTSAGSHALLVVRGAVDHTSAATLRTSLNHAIDQGHREVVVDLGALEFVDSSGLEVLEEAVHRLERAGGELSLRSPSAILRRLLGIVGLDEVIRVEHAAGGAGSGREEPRTGSEEAPWKEDDVLGARLRQMAALPAGDEVVDGALRMVVALAHAAVGGADGVSISLHRHGRLSTVAASDQAAGEMDAGQYAAGEGPCVSASVEGRWFHVGSLADEWRWPAFIPRAKALGINAILSSPLIARDGPVGALNIYSRVAGAFAAGDQQLASVFAAETSAVLTEAVLKTSDDRLALGVAAALHARKVIAQAQGVMMERHGIDQEAAFHSLIDASRQRSIPLRRRAEDVVATTTHGRQPIAASNPRGVA